MQTHLADFIRDTPEGREADAILRKCVHCGFCTATCPTYQLLGDELDGPRGRIYLIKQVLEGAPVTAKTQVHLDRCLSCRSCETTCPSGVQYGRLADIGRGIVESKVGRSAFAGAQRAGLRAVLPYPARFGPLLAIGRALRPFLPGALRSKIPPLRAAPAWPAPRHARRMLVHEGCVQPALVPNIDVATARVLDRVGITLVRAAQPGCCGAVSYHLNAQADGLDFMRRRIDAWWPAIESGVEAIVSTASGCGVTVREYGHLLAADAAYRDKAARVSALCRDVSEVVSAEADPIAARLRPQAEKPVIAFHSPCSLQHGLQLKGGVETLLARLGFTLTTVPDPHLCCGSAGTYSLLQPQIAEELRLRKLAALTSGAPQMIATANIGCLTHLAGGTSIPVRHWIEVLDAHLAGA